MHKKKECTRKNQLSTKPIPRKLKNEKKPISIKPVKSDKDSAEGMDFLHDVMHVHHIVTAIPAQSVCPYMILLSNDNI